MNVKSAFEICFMKQRDFWQSNYGVFPRTPYNIAINERMIIPNSLNNGYIQWQPLRQETSVDLSALEQKLNLSIHPQIKQYFTSYWFLSMIGDIDNITLDFRSVPYGIDILKLVEECCATGVNNLPKGNIHFELGYASVENDDSYLIYIDNETAGVKCVQPEDNDVKELGSLEYVISEMEAGM